MKFALSFPIPFTFAIIAQAQASSFSAVPAAVLSYHQQLNRSGCLYGDEYEEMSVGAVASAYDLGKDWRLFLIPCGAGAYQSSFRVYAAKADQSRIAQLQFIRWSSDKGLYATSSLGDTDFTHRLIHSHSVGRSIGDCGEDGLYRLVVSETNVEVVAKQIRAKWECDGKMDHWPVVYYGN